MNVPPFAINIQNGIKNDIIKKSGNITSVQERIIKLGRKWLKKVVSNNPDIAQFVKKLLLLQVLYTH